MSVRGCVCPHPPLLIPEVGGMNRQRVSATVTAMERLAGELGEVELAVVISPHTPGGVDTCYVKTPPRLTGDFGQFGAPQARLAFDNDLAFVDRLLGLAADEGVTVDPVDGHDARPRCPRADELHPGAPSSSRCRSWGTTTTIRGSDASCAAVPTRVGERSCLWPPATCRTG